MLNALLKVIGVVAGALIADHVVKTTTGKHIHEHVFAWFREINDAVRNWLDRHAHLGVVRVILRPPIAYVQMLLDRVLTSLYGVLPKSRNQIEKKITESNLSQDEIFQLINAEHKKHMAQIDPKIAFFDLEAVGQTQHGEHQISEASKRVPIEELVRQIPAFKECVCVEL